jgi:excisionase family DNA binding protein
MEQRREGSRPTAASSDAVEAPTLADRKWMRVAEAATYADLSIDTIYTACERGELRHVRVGGRRSIRLRSQWVDAWLERFTCGK